MGWLTALCLVLAQQEALDPAKLKPSLVFDTIDRDKSGTLSKEEVDEFSKNFPPSLKNQMMSMLDKNNDGVVEREEGGVFLTQIFMLAKAAASGKIGPNGVPKKEL